MPPKSPQWNTPNYLQDLRSISGSVLPNILNPLNRYQQFMFGGGTQRPHLGRPAAAVPAVGRDIQSAEPEFPTQMGPAYIFEARAQELRRKAPLPPQLPPPSSGFGVTPIVRGTRDGATPDRTQSDTYRQYAQPASPLAAAYQAESKAGRQNMGEIASGLSFGLEGEKARNMEAWAKANPMLAYREFSKRFPSGEPTIGPTPATLQADEALRGTNRFAPGAEPSGFQPGVGNPVVPTEDRSFSGYTQGERMDLGRGVQNLQPFQMAKTTGEGMPQFDVTSAPVSERVRQFLGGSGMPTYFKG